MSGECVGVGARIKELRVSHVDPDAPYPMDLPKLGHAVIVNNVAEEMPGSQVDVKVLKTAYETVGFQVHVHNDCEVQEMRPLKRWMLKDETHVDCNSFSLTVICHGSDKGHLFDKNKTRAWITEDIVGDLSEVETLAGKPKLLVVQACRGRNWNGGKVAQAGGGLDADDDDLEVTHILPDKADVFIAFATVPGYRAFGGDDQGSAYLQCFSKFLQEQYMKRPLDRIYLMVKQAMIKAEQGELKLRQVSEERNSLTRLLFFSEYHQKGSSKNQMEPRIDFEKEIERMKQQQQEELHAVRMELAKQKAERETEKQRMKQLEEENERLKKAAKPSAVPAAATSSAPVKLFSKFNSSIKLPASPGVVTQAKPPNVAKGSKVFVIERLSTEEIPVLPWTFTRITLVESMKQILLWCKLSDKNPPVFAILSITPDGLWVNKTLKAVCPHEKTTFMLPVKIQRTQYIAVSCSKCYGIKLLNLATEAVTTAFYDEANKYRPGRMCQGAKDVLYVLHAVERTSVLELDCSRLEFSVKKVYERVLDFIWGISHVPSQNIVVVVSTKGSVIRAVKQGTGAVAWEVTGAEGGLVDRPTALVYSPEHKVLIAGDQAGRLVIMDPLDGSHLQTIQFLWAGAVVDLLLYYDQLVIWHFVENKHKISFLSLEAIRKD